MGNYNTSPLLGVCRVVRSRVHRLRLLVADGDGRKLCAFHGALLQHHRRLESLVARVVQVDRVKADHEAAAVRQRPHRFQEAHDAAVQEVTTYVYYFNYVLP